MIDGAVHETHHYTIRIEVPRGGFVKRGSRGIDVVSPLPCPFNYGSVDDVLADDGDPQDAIVLGPALKRGATVESEVWAVVGFIDDGVRDDKWVCGERPRRRDRLVILAFFRVWARAKRLLGRDTRLLGWT